MNFISKKVGEDTVVWIESLNRYLVLKKPAYEVFERIARKETESEIIRYVAEMYDLPNDESERFVSEIRKGLLQLDENKSSSHIISNARYCNCCNTEHISHTYKIFDKVFRFSYSNEWLEEYIHPGFAHLQTGDENATHTFHLIQSGDEFILCIDADKSFRWSLDQSEYFKGAVWLQLLNKLYDHRDEDWMGVFHAAGLTRNNQSVLLSAPSGYGKSTLSARLVANGFGLISDDFVPVSLKTKELHSFPSAISVKRGSLETLIPHFPDLTNSELKTFAWSGKELTYLAPPQDINPEKAKVKAIVFPEFNPDIDFNWEKIEPVSVLNNLIQESWIAESKEAVIAFLDWYFQIPCYRLQYNDGNKAVEKIMDLWN